MYFAVVAAWKGGCWVACKVPNKGPPKHEDTEQASLAPCFLATKQTTIPSVVLLKINLLNQPACQARPGGHGRPLVPLQGAPRAGTACLGNTPAPLATPLCAGRQSGQLGGDPPYF